MHGLAKDFAGKIECKVVPFNEGDSQERIQRYELGQHGMVITDQHDTIVWKETGHNQTRDGVEAAIKKALGS